jgi:hypothetical protein
MTTVTIKVDLVETHEHIVEIDGNKVVVHQRIHFDTSIIAIATEKPDSIPPEFKLDVTSLNHVIVELGEVNYEEWEASKKLQNKELEKKLIDCLENDEVIAEWQRADRSAHLYTTVTNWDFLS